MKILNVIGALLDYPTQDLLDNKKPILDIIDETKLLDDSSKYALQQFVDSQTSLDLLDWQSDYDAMFERGRSLSLLLFEHVHGESRDRGQAMINLISEYKQAGLALSQKELPDYIPLFLEFLSTQGKENAIAWISDVAHIFAVLKVRLIKRDSNYASLFQALLNIADVDIDYDDLAKQVSTEKRDDTQEAIDKVWEEEMVTFGASEQNDVCGSSNKPLPTQSKANDIPISMMNTVDVGNLTASSTLTEHAAMGGK